MNFERVAPLEKLWTVAELRALPRDQQDAIMEAAAAIAEKLYRNDPSLTAFEAFGPDDLHDDSTAAPQG